jgi:hypothetical protein
LRTVRTARPAQGRARRARAGRRRSAFCVRRGRSS